MKGVQANEAYAQHLQDSIEKIRDESGKQLQKTEKYKKVTTRFEDVKVVERISLKNPSAKHIVLVPVIPFHQRMTYEGIISMVWTNNPMLNMTAHAGNRIHPHVELGTGLNYQRMNLDHIHSALVGSKLYGKFYLKPDRYFFQMEQLSVLPGLSKIEGVSYNQEDLAFVPSVGMGIRFPSSGIMRLPVSFTLMHSWTNQVDQLLTQAPWTFRMGLDLQ